MNFVVIGSIGRISKPLTVAPTDIADAVVEELETLFTSRHVRYVAGDELTDTETARILGEAIGKPDLQWIVIPSEQMQQGLEAVGMYASVHNGAFWEDYDRNRPAVMGKVKMTDFAKDFAAAYHQR